MNGSATFTGNLVFFLFLLIPGYVTIRAYLWSNVALDNMERITKIVLMATGGYFSLVSVELARISGISSKISSSLPEFITKPFSLTESLSMDSISDLTILESFNLITSQIFMGLIIGILFGMSKYLLFDEQHKKKRDLDQPWETAIQQASRTDLVNIVTVDGKEIKGYIEQVGSPSENYDLLLSGSKEISRNQLGEVEERSLEGITYHHHQDISRIEFNQESLDKNRSWYDRYYMRFLQSCLDQKRNILNSQFWKDPSLPSWPEFNLRRKNEDNSNTIKVEITQGRMSLKDLDKDQELNGVLKSGKKDKGSDGEEAENGGEEAELTFDG